MSRGDFVHDAREFTEGANIGGRWCDLKGSLKAHTPKAPARSLLDMTSH
jgi:hypothetical protein